MAHSFISKTAQYHLIEPQLCELHRHFGHLFVRRLSRLLKRSGYDFDANFIEKLTKKFYHCQKYNKSPVWFNFTLQEDKESNQSNFFDVIYMDGQPLLRVVDELTRFQAVKWVKSMSTQHTWDAL